MMRWNRVGIKRRILTLRLVSPLVAFALLLALRGVAPLRIFIGYSIANAAVCFFFFQPLLNGGHGAPVLALEGLVVLVDGLHTMRDPFSVLDRHRVTSREEWIALLRRHRVEYDEHHLWD